MCSRQSDHGNPVADERVVSQSTGAAPEPRLRAAVGFIAVLIALVLATIGCGSDPAQDIATGAEDNASGGSGGAQPLNPGGAATIDGVPVYVLDPLPEGYRPSLVAPTGRDANLVPTFALYGEPGLENPLSGKTFTVATAGPGIPEEDVVGDGDPVDINGTEVWYQNDDPFETVSWFASDGSVTGVLSDALTQAELIEVASDLLTGDGATAAGFELLAADTSMASVSSLRAGDVGAVNYFQWNDDQFGVLLQVAAVREGADPRGEDLLAAWFVGAEQPGGVAEAWQNTSVEEIDHNGTPVTVTTRADGTVRLVFERDGQLLKLSGQSGDDRDEDNAHVLSALLPLIDTLRPATQSEVDGLLAEQQAAAVPPPQTVTTTGPSITDLSNLSTTTEGPLTTESSDGSTSGAPITTESSDGSTTTEG